MKPWLFLFLALTTGCGLAANSRIADSPAVRAAIIDSVEIGKTTEKQFVLQWGHPVQKHYEGAQVDYIYRDMGDSEAGQLFSQGDSEKYVIVSFQYGLAVDVRSNDTDGCRATFAPRPPGYNLGNPITVHPVANCPGVLRPDAAMTPSGAPPIFEDSYGPGKSG